MLSFGPPWKRLKTFSFLIYSGVSKGNIGNNWANIIFWCITNGRKGEWIWFVFCVENYSQNLGRNNVQRFDNMVFVKQQRPILKYQKYILEPSQTSKLELFANMVNGFQP